MEQNDYYQDDIYSEKMAAGPLPFIDPTLEKKSDEPQFALRQGEGAPQFDMFATPEEAISLDAFAGTAFGGQLESPGRERPRSRQIGFDDYAKLQRWEQEAQP